MSDSELPRVTDMGACLHLYCEVNYLENLNNMV